MTGAAGVLLDPVVAVLVLAGAVGLVGWLAALTVREALWDRRGWRLLDRVGPELVGQVDEAAILRLGLADALELLRCEAVVAVLVPRPGAGGLVATVTAAAGDRVVVRTLPDGHPVPPAARGTAVLPIGGSGRGLGELRVVGGSRSGRTVRGRLARGLAHLLAGALEVERLFEEQRRLADAGRRESLRDDLTGLGNRVHLQEQASALLARSRARGRCAALLMLDLDDFKAVNDALGHAAGDRVLVEVGRRLRGTVRDTDVAVRLGGDEFVVLAGDLPSPEEAGLLALRLEQALDAPVLVEDVQLPVRASVGLAVHGPDGDSLEELLRAADRSMYRAKGGGTADRLPRPRFVSVRDQVLAAQLAGGLPEDQVVLHHQPQVDAATGRVVGFEAFVRWNHPDVGLLQPGEFLPLAEEAGQMNRLTRLVVERALDDRRLLVRDAPEATVSVNVPARSLLDRTLAVDVAAALHRHGTAPSALVLEVVEPPSDPSSLMVATLESLRDVGVAVSVHEFGSGRSSMTALSTSPALQEVKVHASLAARVLASEDAARLVRAMVQSSHSLGLRVVAEGVESARLAARLVELGCDRLQGFHIHEPAPAAELHDWLAAVAREPTFSGVQPLPIPPASSSTTSRSEHASPRDL